MHIAHPVLFPHAAVERLVLGVRMDVDQSRQYQAILSVDHPFRYRWVISSDKDDHVVRERDIRTAAVDVPSGTFVPGNDPVGVLDDSGGH